MLFCVNACVLGFGEGAALVVVCGGGSLCHLCTGGWPSGVRTSATAFRRLPSFRVCISSPVRSSGPRHAIRRSGITPRAQISVWSLCILRVILRRQQGPFIRRASVILRTTGMIWEPSFASHRSSHYQCVLFLRRPAPDRFATRPRPRTARICRRRCRHAATHWRRKRRRHLLARHRLSLSWPQRSWSRLTLRRCRRGARRRGNRQGQCSWSAKTPRRSRFLRAVFLVAVQRREESNERGGRSIACMV